MSAAAVAVVPAEAIGGTEADNHCRWDGHRAGHYEVWYLTANHRESGSGLWIRYTLESPLPGRGEPEARLWFATFDRTDPGRSFAFSRGFPTSSLVIEEQPFAVRIGEARLAHDRSLGALEGAGHSVRWDLRWEPSSWTNRHLPDLVYRTSFADTRVLGPNPDVRLRGTVEIDGRRLVLDGAPGGQSHVWGRKHAHSWAWARCSAFEGGEDAFLEALSVRVRRLGLTLPPLTFATLRLGGARYRLTGFLSALRGRGRYETGRYALRAAGGGVWLEATFTAHPEQMVLAEYRDPDGEPAWCANTEIGDLSLTVRRRGESPRELRSRGAAHFEVGGRQPDPAITRRHLIV